MKSPFSFLQNIYTYIIVCDFYASYGHEFAIELPLNRIEIFSTDGISRKDDNLFRHHGYRMAENDFESFKYASIVTNLRVGVKVFNKTSKKKLQLQVTWTNPTEGRLPDSYNIHVIPVNSTLFDYCGDEIYYGFIRDSKADTWYVPEDKALEMAGLHDGLTIQPECAYNIILQSNPHNGKAAAKTTYSVPDCVKDVCSCRQAKDLAIPTVHAKNIAAQSVNVSWQLPPETYIDKNYSFILRIGEKMASSKNLKGIYNMVWMKQVHAISGQLKYFTVLVIPNTTKSNLMTAVYFVDPRRCIGPPGNFTFNVEYNVNDSSFSLSRSEIMWLTTVPTVTCVAVLLVVIGFVWRKSIQLTKRRFHGNCSKRIHHVSKFRRTYKSVSMDAMSTTRMIFPPLQERNLLYVEKEIEDAKARGEADNFEISSNRISLGKEIGKGMFGRVFLAQAEAVGGIPGFATVAVKKLKSKATTDELEDFLAEISMMKKVGRHPNIVNMIGCCTISQPYLIVMEFVPCGDLLQYLRELRSQVRKPMMCTSSAVTSASTSRCSESSSYVEPETTVTTGTVSLFSSENNLLQPTHLQTSAKHSTFLELTPKLEYILDSRELQNFALQIAKGMTHLEEKHITHRDLAARNILIDRNKTLKISDFGLSRTGIYVNTKNKKVPLRWLSIEAIKDSLYSSKSDVWAFGIVLWEIGTLGGFPYSNVLDLQLLSYLLEGNRLDKPDNCSDGLYKMMKLCWSQSADARPAFQQLVSYLDTSITSKRVYVNFDDVKHTLVLPPIEQLPTQNKTGVSDYK